MPIDTSDYSSWKDIVNTVGDEIRFTDSVRVLGLLGGHPGKQFIDIHRDDWHSVIAKGATFTKHCLHGTVTRIEEPSLQTGLIRVYFSVQPPPAAR